FSTVNTTPQLLHTRAVLKLPSGMKVPPSPPFPHTLRRKELDRVGKRLQLVTKEPDWRVAKTYAALAELDESNQSDKEGEKHASRKALTLEERSIDAY